MRGRSWLLLVKTSTKQKTRKLSTTRYSWFSATGDPFQNACALLSKCVDRQEVIYWSKSLIKENMKQTMMFLLQSQPTSCSVFKSKMLLFQVADASVKSGRAICNNLMRYFPKYKHYLSKPTSFSWFPIPVPALILWSGSRWRSSRNAPIIMNSTLSPGTSRLRRYIGKIEMSPQSISMFQCSSVFKEVHQIGNSNPFQSSSVFREVSEWMSFVATKHVATRFNDMSFIPILVSEEI